MEEKAAQMWRLKGGRTDSKSPDRPEKRGIGLTVRKNRPLVYLEHVQKLKPGIGGSGCLCGMGMKLEAPAKKTRGKLFLRHRPLGDLFPNQQDPGQCPSPT